MLKLALMFTDNMVFQQMIDLPVWGTTSPSMFGRMQKSVATVLSCPLLLYLNRILCVMPGRITRHAICTTVPVCMPSRPVPLLQGK